MIPQLYQWLAWKASHDTHYMKRLCFVCGIEASWFELATVRVGSLVKKWVEFDTGATDTQGDPILDTKRVIIPMMATGMACPTCQYAFNKAEGAEQRRHTEAVKAWEAATAPAMVPAWMIAVGMPRVEMDKATKRAGYPAERTPYLDVAAAVAEMPRAPFITDDDDTTPSGVDAPFLSHISAAARL